jgi:hypothetical protein
MKALAIIETTDKGTVVTFDEATVFDLSGVSSVTHEMIKEMVEKVKNPEVSSVMLQYIWRNRNPGPTVQTIVINSSHGCKPGDRNENKIRKT